MKKKIVFAFALLALTGSAFAWVYQPVEVLTCTSAGNSLVITKDGNSFQASLKKKPSREELLRAMPGLEKNEATLDLLLKQKPDETLPSEARSAYELLEIVQDPVKDSFILRGKFSKLQLIRNDKNEISVEYTYYRKRADGSESRRSPYLLGALETVRCVPAAIIQQ